MAGVKAGIDGGCVDGVAIEAVEAGLAPISGGLGA